MFEIMKRRNYWIELLKEDIKYLSSFQESRKLPLGLLIPPRISNNIQKKDIQKIQNTISKSAIQYKKIKIRRLENDCRSLKRRLTPISDEDKVLKLQLEIKKLNLPKECLEKCKEILSFAKKAAQRCQLADQETMFDKEAAKVRWFLLPSEAKALLLGQSKELVHDLPFSPQCFHSHSQHLENRQWNNYKNASSNDKQLSSQVKINGNKHDTLNSLHNNVSFCYEDSLEMSQMQEQGNCSNTNLESQCLVQKVFCEDFLQKNNAANPSRICSSKSICALIDCELKQVSTTENTSFWYSPPKSIFKPFLQAVNEFEMIQPNDRILVCLSGGKDSLSLLHTVHQYQFYSKKKDLNFQFGAVTVDPGSSAYDPSPLKEYLSALDVPYFYEEQEIMKQATELPECTSICSFCSRMKRGRIYAAARRGGYNVIALGQHLDDLAESFFMSVFHNGRLRTMKAHYTVKEKDIRVIRPFVYVREKNLRKFAEEKKLPVIAENCPACFEAPKERHRMKQLLAAQEILFPCLFWNLKSSLYPLLSLLKQHFQVTTNLEGCR